VDDLQAFQYSDWSFEIQVRVGRQDRKYLALEVVGDGWIFHKTCIVMIDL
jgi:hypothetical protein